MSCRLICVVACISRNMVALSLLFPVMYNPCLIIYIRVSFAAGTKKLVKRNREKDGWIRQYRCSLSGTVRFFSRIAFRKCHLDCMQKTPFYNFVLPFVKGKYTPGSVRGLQDGTVQMLMSYRKDRNLFAIGVKDLTLEPNEFDIIFGIKSGDVAIRPKRTPKRECVLAMRKFKKYGKKIRPGHLKEVLKETVNEDDEVAVQDTVKIIIIIIISNIFFVAGADNVNMWFFKICENLEMLSTFNWGLAVVSYLMKSIQNRKAKSVRGCTILFMVSYCFESDPRYM